MSDDESSTTSGGGGEVTLYECRKCPGQRFTAPERDNHRLQHRREKEQQERRGRGRRASSPVRSEVTLFTEVVVRETEDGEEEVVSPSTSAKKRPAGPGRDKPGPASKKKKREEEKKKKEKPKKERRKRESVKRYDSEVEFTKNPGA